MEGNGGLLQSTATVFNVFVKSDSPASQNTSVSSTVVTYAVHALSVGQFVIFIQFE